MPSLRIRRSSRSWRRAARSACAARRNEGLRWHVGGFYTRNHNDILFQTTGGPQANVGFFANVGDTLRTGIELSVSQRLQRLRWSAEYSYINATFDDDFVVNSPNHPIFTNDPASPAIAGEDKLLVTSGSSIPGIPQHQANLGLDYSFSDRFELGADVVLRSGVYLRGDEANLLDRTDGYSDPESSRCMEHQRQRDPVRARRERIRREVRNLRRARRAR